LISHVTQSGIVDNGPSATSQPRLKDQNGGPSNCGRLNTTPFPRIGNGPSANSQPRLEDLNGGSPEYCSDEDIRRHQSAGLEPINILNYYRCAYCAGEDRNHLQYEVLVIENIPDSEIYIYIYI
jgi:hypothetical protein